MIQLRDETKGFLAGIISFSFWGTLVLFWRLLDHVPASEVLAWRVVFCFVLIAPVLWLTHRFDEVRQAFVHWPTLWRVMVSTVLIGLNWYTYIWAVSVGLVLETSLGYYMTPLMSIALGLVLLGERFSRLQLLALLLAAGGVLWALVVYGQFPWIGLALTTTFALYGFVRKTVDVEALPGLFLETALLLPLGLLWIGWLTFKGESFLNHPDMFTGMLLVLTGVLTSIPLGLFAYAARHVPLSTLGFLQYIPPTGTFLIGIYVVHEPLSTSTLMTFGCIWLALVIHSVDSLRLMRQKIQKGK